MSSEKQPTRWYIVEDKRDGAGCLVEASNRAQAYRRAGEHYCIARPATVDEALKLARDGRDVIYAPQVPEQLDLEEQASTVAASSADAAKDGGRADALESTPVASAPLTPAPDNPPAQLPRSAPTPRKASEVFGAGFGPRSAADDID